MLIPAHLSLVSSSVVVVSIPTLSTTQPQHTYIYRPISLKPCGLYTLYIRLNAYIFICTMSMRIYADAASHKSLPEETYYTSCRTGGRGCWGFWSVYRKRKKVLTCKQMSVVYLWKRTGDSNCPLFAGLFFPFSSFSYSQFLFSFRWLLDDCWWLRLF